MTVLKIVLLLALAGYVLFGIMLTVLQRKFLYFPDKTDFNSCPALLDAQKITHGNTRMYVHEVSNKWIVVYHGNAGSACGREYWRDYFDNKIYSYIIVEYSGYGGDGQQASQPALMNNVKDVADFLAGKNPESVFIIGESLGTALAAFHTSIKAPDRLLLGAPFDSVVSVGQSRYPMYPIKFILRDSWNSAQWLKNADNVLIIHGSKDDIVPVRFGRLLFNAIGGKHKTFLEISGADHNNLLDIAETENAVKDFLK